jgi:hypothetical protein
VASSDGTLYEIDIRAPQNGLPSTYYVDLFLDGPVSDKPTSWAEDTNYLGSSVFIATRDPEKAPNVTVSGVVPLNSRLEKLYTLGKLKDLTEASVAPLLRDHLIWRVRLADDTLVPPSNIQELSVAFASINVTIPTSPFELPKYTSDWKIHYEATQGKPAGLTPVDAA